MTTKRPDGVAGLFVVETYDGRAYLGELERAGDRVVIYSGMQGRPPILSDDEVARITPAGEHPDVELAK